MPVLATMLIAAAVAQAPVRAQAKVGAWAWQPGPQLQQWPERVTACLDALGGRVTGSVGAARAQDPVARDIGLDRWIALEFPHGTEPVGACAMLAGAWEGFEVVEPDGSGSLADLPDDPSFPQQWALRNTGQTGGVPGSDVNAVSAWSQAPSDGLTIAFLDGGVQPLAEFGNRILPGWNVPQQSTVTTDTCGGHGTHVTGIAAAAGNNAALMAGMCWDASILPVVIVNPCTFFEQWVAEGLVWAIDHGADVVNMSLQSNAGGQLLRDAVLYGEALNVPMVAATGNNNLSLPAFPARWPETIAVAASTHANLRWVNSNYGAEVDLAAPGENVLSLTTTGGVISRSGTSMAAPHVAGAVALMLSVNPSLTNAQIRSILAATSVDMSPAGVDEFTGAGRLDAGAAVAMAASLAPPPGDLDGDGDVDGADLGIMLVGWGPCGSCASCPGDLDGNCDVGGSDLGALLSSWSPD
jgi:subtilisin family serine protease